MFFSKFEQFGTPFKLYFFLPLLVLGKIFKNNAQLGLKCHHFARRYKIKVSIQSVLCLLRKTLKMCDAYIAEAQYTLTNPKPKKSCM